MEFDNIQVLKKNFEQVYYNSIQNEFNALETERVKVRRQVVTFRLIGFIIALLILFSVIYYFPDLLSTKELRILMLEGYAVVLVLIYAIVKVARTYVKKIFEKKIKKLVMPQLMQAFGGFKWTTSGVIADLELVESGLFRDFEYKEGDDNFYGKYSGLDVYISEIQLLGSSYDLDGKEHVSIVFDGLIVSCYVKKRFQGHTMIKQRSVINNNLYGEIKFDDPEFTRKYAVDSSNPVEARDLLTPSFISKFKNLQTVFKAEFINASFQDNKMILAISTNKDFFNLGNLNKPINDTKQLIKLLEEFISIMEIIDELKINQNIVL